MKMNLFEFHINRIYFGISIQLYLFFTFFLFVISLRADSNNAIVWLKVTSPVNVQIILNKKFLMQIDRTTGQNFTYRRVETNLDAPIEFKGKSFSFYRKVSDFYFGNINRKYISNNNTIFISIRIGRSNQSDLVLTDSQLTSAYGNENDIPILINFLQDKNSKNSESKRQYAIEALGYIGKGRTDVRDVLVDALKNEENFRLKAEIAKTLGKLEDISVLSEIKVEYFKIFDRVIKKLEKLAINKDSKEKDMEKEKIFQKQKIKKSLL